MRERPSSRLIVIAPDDTALLFYFTLPDLDGEKRRYWSTPGGGVKPGETYPAAARRELFEETGFDVDVGGEVERRIAEFSLPDGTMVMADERYFLARVGHKRFDSAKHSAHEQIAMTSHRWWSVDDLRNTDEQFFPENFADMVEAHLEGEVTV